MTNREANNKLKFRLEKLASMDYQSLEIFEINEALNKAINNVVRRGLKGNNQKLEGDEETTFSSDDFAVLLKEVTIIPTKKDLYDEVKIPDDYRYFKKLTPVVSRGNCEGLGIVSVFVEEANSDIFLKDFNYKPSFSFEETFHTEVKDYFKVYHNKDFTINKVNLVYYRNPKKINIEIDSEVLWEFKDDLAEIMVDEAVLILAGDNENAAAYQNAEKNIDKNT